MTQSDSPAQQPDASTLDVSVILPVHNEAGHLRGEVDRIEAALEASPYSFEIIVVDDGSTDGSLDELADLAASGAIRVIRFAREPRLGLGAQGRHARAAHGRVMVWTDADMTYPNDQIPRSSRSSTATTRSSAPALPSRARTVPPACPRSGSFASSLRSSSSARSPI